MVKISELAAATTMADGDLFEIERAGGTSSNSITKANVLKEVKDGTAIAPGAITTAKIAAGAVTDALLKQGKVRARQGGNATEWGSGGTTNYNTDDLDVLIQVGTINTSASGTVTITFPVPFGSNPIIIGSQQGSVTTRAWFSADSTSATAANVSAINTSNARVATAMSWIAIGIAA